MNKKIIHLANGSTILAEVNGKTLDGQRGYVLHVVNTGNLRGSLAESVEIEVRRRIGNEWEEVKKS